jgi:hypothetical protein
MAIQARTDDDARIEAVRSISKDVVIRGSVPRGIGNSLINAIAKVAQQTQRMTEGELEAYGHKEFEKLQRVTAQP